MADACTLRPAADDLDAVEAMLSANDLPTADVREKPDCFYALFDGDNRVGVGGVELHGDAGLLRSVVVRESERGNGYGAELCARLEGVASEAGVAGFRPAARGTSSLAVEELYLLTTTAAPYFGDRGYETVDRADVPAAIRETTQFASLCPESATCMRNPLAGP